MVPQKEETMITARNDLKPNPGIIQGFTLTETCVSMLIILLAIIYISRIMIHSMDSLKNSKSRLEVSEKFQSCAHYLLSRPFTSEELQAGNFTRSDRHFTISWQVNDLTPRLKQIILGVRRSRIAKQGTLYKSKVILPMPIVSFEESVEFNLVQKSYRDSPEQVTANREKFT